MDRGECVCMRVYIPTYNAISITKPKDITLEGASLLSLE